MYIGHIDYVERCVSANNVVLESTQIFRVVYRDSVRSFCYVLEIPRLVTTATVLSLLRKFDRRVLRACGPLSPRDATRQPRRRRRLGAPLWSCQQRSEIPATEPARADSENRAACQLPDQSHCGVSQVLGPGLGFGSRFRVEKDDSEGNCVT